MKLKIATVAVLMLAPLAVAANVIISPNMGMPVPVVGTDPGPDWANNINASLSIIDSHDHTAGHGVPVPPAGLNINSDLTFQGNNATNLKSARFVSQSGTLPGSVLSSVYVDGGDLWYNNGSGAPVQLTIGNVPAGGAGTISGLPSGTASASFAGSTFTFQSATNTPANMAVGPVSIGTNTVSSKTVTLAPPGGLAANYNLTFPNGLPGATSFLNSDTSGNLAFAGTTGTGNVVLANAPTITGTANFPDIIDLRFLDLTPAGHNLNVVSMSSNGSKYGNISVLNNTGTGAWALGYASSDTSVLDTPVLTWTGGGRVGIGNLAPIATLDVNGTINGNSETLASTGGNVPHACSTRTNSTAGSTGNVGITLTCNAGERVTGGGCSSTSAVGLSSSWPSANNAWSCSYLTNGSIQMSAYGICCQY